MKMPPQAVHAVETRFQGHVAGAATSPAGVVVRPYELAEVLDHFPGITHLSLDCFDTVVWRHTDRPFDVFYAAAQRGAFKAHGITARGRRSAESTARTLYRFRHGRREVSLDEIYRLASPQLTDEDVRELVEQELAAECDLCFAHPAAIELLRSAGARELPVTIVSDTYFDAQQLGRLLAHVLPRDVMTVIRRVVCSSEYGVAKSEGLLELAYGDEAVRRDAILHVGDNLVSDYRAALEAGMKAAHLLQRDADEIDRDSMRASALSILDSGVRNRVPLHAPYRGPLSTWQSHGDEASLLGGGVLGPVLHAFVRWVAQEKQRIAQNGRKAKFVFLLRDGHLPFLAHKALDGGQDCSLARISRFTAFAASFRSLTDIDDYLGRFVSTRRFHVLARQLLLPDELATKIVTRAAAAADPVTAFCEGVRNPGVVASILRSSSILRQRMKRHLERETGMQRGDRVVFVDVGYLGTAQRVLKPVFDEWGVDLGGRYLLAVGAPTDAYRGMIDASWCDERVMDSLVPYLSLVDNLCACPGGSVEDYTDDGVPVLAGQLLHPEQVERVTRLQAECVRFVRHAEEFRSSSADRVETQWLREAALGELVRLIFFPTASELKVLSGFQVEVNLGSRDSRLLLDAEAGLEQLRQSGVSFSVGNGSMSARYPAGLRAAGLELSMALFAQQRFGLDIPQASWTCRSEDLDVLILRGEESASDTVRAVATHDGFFSAIVPVGDGGFHLGLLLGRSYAWLQVHSATLVPLSRLMGDAEGLAGHDIRSSLIFDGMRDHGRDLYECTGEGALVMIPAGISPYQEGAAFRFVFRPIARRR